MAEYFGNSAANGERFERVAVSVGPHRASGALYWAFAA